MRSGDQEVVDARLILGMAPRALPDGDAADVRGDQNEHARTDQRIVEYHACFAEQPLGLAR